MDTGFFLDWIAGAAAVISSCRDHLTQLDSAIGDADHGVNLGKLGRWGRLRAFPRLIDVGVASPRPG